MQDPFAWGVPESVRQQGPDAVRAARAVVLGGLLTAAAASWIAWIQLTQGSRLVAAVCAGVALAGGAIPPVLRRTGAWRPLGYLLCSVLFAAPAFVAASTGGALVSASFYLGLVPLLATVFGGARVGAAWAVACCAFIVGLEALRRTGFAFPVEVSAEVAAQSAFRGALVFEGLLLAVALVYDHLRQSSLRDVEESEARSRAVTEHSGDLVSELDEEGAILFASPSHHTTLGWDLRAILGTNLAARVHPEDGARFRSQLREAVVLGNTRGEPLRVQTADGGWRWLEPDATAFATPDGRHRVVVVARDLTERLHLESELRQSQKMEAIGQLAGGVAHDFNNLLMVIMGYAQQLTAGSASATEEPAMVREILRAAEQGEGLTRQLLAVSRPARGRRRPVDLNDVAGKVESLLSRLIGEDVLLALQLEPGLPMVFADPAHLEQILVNLAVNARDAMPEGGTLRIETERHGDRVRLAVTDSGVGMDTRTRERVFEAFFTTKEPGSGTGLGLAVVYSIVRSMDGEIRVESEPGDGTTVLIDLPATEDETRAAAAGEAEPLPRGDETILVAEDRADVRALVVRTLEEAGYRVLEARDGIDALGMIERERAPVHLVLSDVVMPRMGGPELARVLVKRDPRPLILFMSGHPERGPALASAPCDGPLLMKPVRTDDLCRRVRETLDAGADATLELP